MLVEGDNACAIVNYDYINSNGGKMNQDVAELWEVKKGKLAKLTIYFDFTAYMSFLRS
jgi:ketosteroid isomerase-like protein